MEKLNNLADVTSFLGDRAESADKVIKETKENLDKQGWDIDKEIAKGKRESELLKEGKKPSEVLEIIKKEFDPKDNFTPPGAKGEGVDDDEVEYDIVEETNPKRTGRPYKHTKELIKELNEPEEQVMVDFQKLLDDYMSKNKKGREDIPATYKR